MQTKKRSSRIHKLRIEPLEPRWLLFAQTAEHPSHQWITEQGYLFFEHQFGESEIKDFLGEVRAFPASDPSNRNELFIEGVFDEDEAGENPFGQGELRLSVPVLGVIELPVASLRHFWSHDKAFERDFDDGLGTDNLTFDVPVIDLPRFFFPSFDSAANRGLKYLTGGFGLTNELDGGEVLSIGSLTLQGGGWGFGTTNNNFVGPGEGAIEIYSRALTNQQRGLTGLARDRKGQAYYFLGHTVHLLQDMALPAHVQGDQHLELFGTGLFPDPVHDWGDGQVFVRGGPGPDSNNRIASFDDTNFNRFREWKFHEDLGGVGRKAGIYREPIEKVIDAPLRSQREIDTDVFVPNLPIDATAYVVPFYKLFYELASAADDFDSRTKNGQTGLGFQLDCETTDGYDSCATFRVVGSTVEPITYDDWTKDELLDISDSLMPRAMVATAEAIRLFYGLVDDQPPVVQFASPMSSNPEEPQIIADFPFNVLATATDQETGDSGIGVFKLEFKEMHDGGGGTNWTELKIDDVTRPLDPRTLDRRTAQVMSTFAAGQQGITYGFRLTAEDGAGKQSTAEAYVRKGGISVVEVLDTSDSMDGQGLEDVKQAAKFFQGLMRTHDRIGVVSYSTRAAAVVPLKTLTGFADSRLDTIDAINALTAGGQTAIGAGIRVAAGELQKQNQDPKRALIVMSDGMNNTSPGPLSEVLKLPDNVKVFTIGLGKEVDVRTLTTIAEERGGKFFASGDLPTLQMIHGLIAGELNGEQNGGNGEGETGAGQIRVSEFSVDPAMEQVSFGLHWSGSDMDLVLVTPRGGLIDRKRAELDDRIEFIEGLTYKYFRIKNPEPGDWQVRVLPIDVPDGGEPYRLSVTAASPIVADLHTDHLAYDGGETIRIQVAVTDAGHPVLNARPIATITPPAGASYGVAQAVLVDDGQHDDGVAGDGIYGTAFTGNQVPGLYQIQVRVSGESNAGFDFSRSSELTVFVDDSESSAAPSVASHPRDGFVYLAAPDKVSAFTLFNQWFDWHNAADPADVDGDRHRVPADALAVINYLLANGSGALPARRGLADRIDVNNDGFASPIDALMVINRLLYSPVTAVAEGESPFVLHRDLSPTTGPGSLFSSNDALPRNDREAITGLRPLLSSAAGTDAAPPTHASQPFVANVEDDDLETALADFAGEVARVWWDDLAQGSCPFFARGGAG